VAASAREVTERVCEEGLVDADSADNRDVSARFNET
jgi:hypothetical protein